MFAILRHMALVVVVVPRGLIVQVAMIQSAQMSTVVRVVKQPYRDTFVALVEAPGNGKHGCSQLDTQPISY